MAEVIEDQELENGEEEQLDLESNEEGFVDVSAGTYYGDAVEDEEGKKKRPRIDATVSFRPGENLTEAVELHGEENVYVRYRRGVERDLSNAIRSALNKHLNANAAPEQIPDLVEAELRDWRPTAERRTTRRSPEENVLANFSTLTPEKQQEILARLQQAAAAAAQEQTEVAE